MEAMPVDFKAMGLHGIAMNAWKECCAQQWLRRATHPDDYAAIIAKHFAPLAAERDELKARLHSGNSGDTTVI